ncbi:unnamed protein product [Thlaspi arvense]|uniref:Uncharacterized protein n=1 Tax=Thlaspi arvense TaxID=13288 RepID=A0AAU9SUK2_THLAR|nr:unnamed protein product [Thlaspi arvense]
MANTTVRGQMIFQDENALAHGKKAVAAGKSKKSSLAGPKKNGAGLGSRKALHDITNKSKLQPQASSKTRKKNAEEVDFDISKEGYLHDHSKCIEQQRNQWDSYFSQHITGLDTNSKEDVPEYNIEKLLFWRKSDDGFYLPLRLRWMTKAATFGMNSKRYQWTSFRIFWNAQLGGAHHLTRPSITILPYLHRLCHGILKLSNSSSRKMKTTPPISSSFT